VYRFAWVALLRDRERHPSENVINPRFP